MTLSQPPLAGNGRQDVIRELPGLTGDAVSCDRCGRRHRTWRTLLRCYFGSSLYWLGGDAPPTAEAYCTVAYCPHGGAAPWTTVILFADESAARAALWRIDKGGCGSRCRGRHQIYLLSKQGTEHGRPCRTGT
jgi:hypothetical protein